MKKKIALGCLYLALCISLVGCGTVPDSTTSAAPSPTQQEEISPPSPSPDLKQAAADAVADIKQKERNNLTDDELDIYNEVWAALDAEPNRPEEEIFAELAPNYGMTGSELKDFIMKAMEKVYG